MPRPNKGHDTSVIRLPNPLCDALKAFKKRYGSCENVRIIHKNDSRQMQLSINKAVDLSSSVERRLDSQSETILSQYDEINALKSELETVKANYFELMKKAQMMQRKLSEQASENEKGFWRKFLS